METTILNQIDNQLQFITRLLERDIEKGEIVYHYKVNETKYKIFDWITLKNYLNVTTLAKLNYLDEIVLRTEKFIGIYNGFDDSNIKKLDEKFIYKSKHQTGWTIDDFRMIVLTENEIMNLPSRTDSKRHFYLDKYLFNNYNLHDFAKKCNNIRNVILNFYPDLSKATNKLNAKELPFYCEIGSLFLQGFIVRNKHSYCYKEKCFNSVSKLSEYLKTDVLKTDKYVRQYVNDTLNETGIKNLYSNTHMKNIIEYCKTHNIDIQTDFNDN